MKWQVSRAALKALTSIGATASAVVVPYLEQALKTGKIDSITSMATTEEPPHKKRKSSS